GDTPVPRRARAGDGRALRRTEISGARVAGGEIGVDGNEPTAERIDAEAESLERLCADEIRCAVVSKERDHRALASLQSHLHFGHLAHRGLSGRKDHALRAERPIAETTEDCARKREARCARV